MSEELELFYEDAAEQLQLMENALLEAEQSMDQVRQIDQSEPIDPETIGAIFRAMHTIKGTAGMFDFDDIVSFTHIAESLLDEVREQRVLLDEKLATVFMAVKDVVTLMIESKVHDAPLDERTLELVSQLKEQLEAAMPGNDEAVSAENTQHNLADIAMGSGSAMQSEPVLWHVSIRFSEDFFTSGMDILSIFRFFNKLGEIELNVPIIDRVPAVEDIDPLKTYIGFELDFSSSCAYEDIEEIFEFVEDDVELLIFEHSEQNKWYELFEKEAGLEEVLTQNGVYNKCPENLENLEYSMNSGGGEQESQDDVLKHETHKSSSEPTSNEVSDNQAFHDNQANTIQTVIQKDLNTTSSQKQEQQVVKTKEVHALKKSSTLRVESSKIDLLINKMGEMVIQNSKLIQMAEDRADDDLEEIAVTMNTLLEEVRDGVMDMRMVQVKDSFIKFKRIVNDTAKKLGKTIDFIIEGEETELDKSVVEKLNDPLVHMLRNSIDHGIESPQIREQNGKKATGTVYLRAYPDAGSIVIEIEDDGAGINKEAILKKAIQNGVVSSKDQLSDKEIYKLIFHAGFSTAQQVTDISGRGVGMDVVKKNIEDLRGIIDVKSKLGQGSKITIRLPLTLAVIDGFLVQAGDTKYIIPLDDISQCIEFGDEYKSDIKGAGTINIRGDVVPMIDVKAVFDERIVEGVRQNIVIVHYGGYRVGLKVDELYGEQQTVIKPLGDMFANLSEFSGGTILGSGEVALIFDIPKLIQTQINDAI